MIMKNITLISVLFIAGTAFAGEIPFAMKSTMDRLERCAIGCPFQAKKELSKELFETLSTFTPNKEDEVRTVYAYQRKYGQIVRSHIEQHLESGNLLGAIEAAAFAGTNDCNLLSTGNARGTLGSVMNRLEEQVVKQGIEAFEQEPSETALTLAVWNIRDHQSDSAREWVNLCLEISPDNKQCAKWKDKLATAKQSYSDLLKRGGITSADMKEVNEALLCDGYNPLSDMTLLNQIKNRR